ncbi:MAG: DUF1016 family protein [Alphaproteobacteria bacterium]|nr:DUF1016 family protein [Alphaproteobacteria bacterium]
MKPVSPELKNYEKLLAEVKGHVLGTEAFVTRKRVEMAWNIGRSISRHLAENEETYGKHVVKQLEKDLGISSNVLYRMQRFYRSYPNLAETKLSWSHYRVLAGVKKDNERALLEKSASKRNLSAEELQQKISKKKSTPRAVKERPETVLRPQRGRLFCYKITKRPASDALYFDCGFGIFKEAGEELPKGVEIVETVKRGKNYLLQKSDAKPRQIYVYKAHLVRIIDGDTLHVDLDLGFGIRHEEKLRLRAIDAAEGGTNDGRKATYSLTKILEKLPFLVVKTNQTDIYGRYVADVYLPNEEEKMSPQETADRGTYLNQLLLDKGLVDLY